MSNNFLTKLYTDDIIPVPDYEAASSLIQENVDLIQNYDYPDVLSDDSIPIVEQLTNCFAFLAGVNRYKICMISKFRFPSVLKI